MQAIVLAAGRSERMGTPKPLLRWRGVPLLTRTIDALIAGGASTVRVVVADAEVAALAGTRAVWNESPERGMLRSVQVGLAALEPGHAILICPCDLPRLTEAHVRRVVGAWEGDGAAIVVPTFQGKRGHPTLFGPKVAPEILGMDPLREGLNALVRRREAGMVTVEMDDPGPVRDTDTPEEWAALVAEEDGDDAVE